MSFQLKDSAQGRPRYDLNRDHTQGFEEAVRNGQTRLAMEYLVNIVREQALEIADLKGRLPSPVETTVVDPVAEVDALVTKPARAKKKLVEE